MAKTSQVIIDIQNVMHNGGVDPQADLKPIRRVIRTLVKIFDQIDDVRKEGMCNYPLSVIIMTTFLAVLGGANTWVEIELFGKAKINWLKRFLPIEGDKMPSHDTYNRVFSLLNPAQFQRVVLHILQENMNTIRRNLVLPTPPAKRHIAVDGKEERGTGRSYVESQGEKVRNMQTLHIYDATNEIVLASEIIDKKTNEIPVAQRLLGILDLRNATVTFDALHMQRDTIKVIVNGGADYIGGLKGNQSGMLEMVKYAFDTSKLDELRRGQTKKTINITGKGNTSCLCDIGGEIYGNSVVRTVTKKHDQVETRTLYRINAPEDEERDKNWAQVKSYIMVVKDIAPTNPNKAPTTETRYYMSSLTDIAEIYDGIVMHWSVENKLHWHLDYTYERDRNSTMNRTAFENLSQMINLCASLQKLVKTLFPRMSLKATRKYIGWNTEEAVERILSAFDDEVISATLENVKYDEKQAKKVAQKLAEVAQEAMM